MMNFRVMTAAIKDTVTEFTPDKIASLAAWYDAADSSTITKNISNQVSAWRDKSANGHHLSATGSAQPTWSDNQLNNNPVLDFDGTANMFALPTGLHSIANGSNTIFIVCKTNLSNSLQVILSMSENGVTRLDMRYPFISGAIYYQSRNGNGGGVSLTGIDDTSYGILMGRRNGTTQAISFNGGNEVTNNNGASESGVNAGYIGSFNGSAFFFNGQLAELLIFSSSLSSSDIADVNNYLGGKW